MNDSAIEQQAIELHSSVAGTFEKGYETRQPHQERVSPWHQLFAYSRIRLDSYLYPAIQGEGRQVLDVGCGPGHYISQMRQLGFDPSGVDGSSQMVERARENNPGSDIREARVHRLPFAGDAFDVAICIEVLRYLPDPVPCIREMARVLRPGGRCLATAMPVFNLNAYWLVNRIDAAIPIHGLKHLKQYFTTPATLKRQYADAGFEQIDIRGVYFGPTSWLGRLIPPLLPPVLRLCGRVDPYLAEHRWLSGLSNMVLVSARKKR